MPVIQSCSLIKSVSSLWWSQWSRIPFLQAERSHTSARWCRFYSRPWSRRWAGSHWKWWPSSWWRTGGTGSRWCCLGDPPGRRPSSLSQLAHRHTPWSAQSKVAVLRKHSTLLPNNLYKRDSDIFLLLLERKKTLRNALVVKKIVCYVIKTSALSRKYLINVFCKKIHT